MDIGDSRRDNIVQPLLGRMESYQVAGLTVYADQGVVLSARVFDDFNRAWHDAHVRIERQVFGVHRDRYCPHVFPPASIVLTNNRATFLRLYHTPERAHLLPAWVKDYVHYAEGIYVCMPGEKEARGESFFDEKCHEFTHLILPDELGVPPETLPHILPVWCVEGICVLVNQWRGLQWLANSIQRAEMSEMTLAAIAKNGLFFFDRKPPAENIAYQYCAAMLLAIGMQSFERLADLGEITDVGPLLPVFFLASEACSKGLPFHELLLQKGIDVGKIEHSLRHNLFAQQF